MHFVFDFFFFIIKKVPKPTYKVTVAVSIDLASSFLKTPSVKCKPAVGAATEPLSFAKWFDIALSLSPVFAPFLFDIRRQRNISILCYPRIKVARAFKLQ